MPTDIPVPCIPGTDATTLSLVAFQKDRSANPHGIRSVAYSPDGSKVVSGASSGTIKVWDSTSLELIEERKGDGATMDKSGEVAERDGATLRLKEGGAFYAPSPLQCVAVHWPKLVAGAQSGELYHLEVEEA